MNLKTTPLLLLSIILATRSIAAGPVSSSEIDGIPGSKRASQGVYSYHRNRVTKGVQGPFYYEQHIDHFINNSGKYLFDQRYWVNDEHYQHGGPVFLMISNMEPAGNSLRLLGSDQTFKSRFVRLAERTQGMLVVLEHRYFGESFPVNNLSEDNLQYLTVGQALADLQSFAQSGMGNRGLIAASRPRSGKEYVPWVLIGGGYAGSLVHWTMRNVQNRPNVFRAGYSSSAMVQVKENHWEYWEDVARLMDADCVNDVANVVAEFDDYSKKDDMGTQIGRAFGLNQIKHADDIAEILSRTIDYALNPLKVEKFCNALKKARRGTVGEVDRLDLAWKTWRRWNERVYENNTDAQWTSYNRNQPKYTDIDRPGQPRAIRWLKCNELGLFKTSAKHREVEKPIVSKLLSIDRERSICKNYFPKRYKGESSMPHTKAVSKTYGGWHEGPAKTVFYIHGADDPFIGLSFNPNRSPDKNPAGDQLQVVERARHLQDFISSEGEHGAMDEATKKGFEYIERWVDQWYRLDSLSTDSD